MNTFGNQKCERKGLKNDVLHRLVVFDKQSGFSALFEKSHKKNQPEPKIVLKTMIT